MTVFLETSHCTFSLNNLQYKCVFKQWWDRLESELHQLMLSDPSASINYMPLGDTFDLNNWHSQRTNPLTLACPLQEVMDLDHQPQTPCPWDDTPSLKIYFLLSLKWSTRWPRFWNWSMLVPASFGSVSTAWGFVPLVAELRPEKNDYCHHP